MEVSKQVIILGRSPFVEKVKDSLPKLIKRYFTVGINQIVDVYPEVDVAFFFDKQDLNIYKNNRIVINESNVNPKISSSLNIETFSHQGANISLDKNTNVVGFSELSITSCLNWCYKQGFTTAYLIGHDLNYGQWEYSYSGKILNPAEFKIKKARDFIYKMNRFMNIYQVNPDSDMALVHIPIELL